MIAEKVQIWQLKISGDDINKDAIIVKKEEKVDVKPIVSNKKKQKCQLEVMQDTMKGLIIDAQKASDQLLRREKDEMEEAQLE